ncbi:HAD-IIIC family phosphatase [Marinifilum sp. D714]|uniref:HAD-IIIC family phosphatase n=1 Tax=Marinifilum sp. D714 TaxID=2937523 RepID=UPI0027D0241E|nr:HAD-IIIC family phosphatase [Marinifilum sp. D714]MDQ2180655.1 HAD-IIIC family phosphatase [Marinifilum sp. D714]
MESIKLIIWDLDETFWKGTLSEEGIIPINENIQLIKHLSSRGIINSIASKNEFETAKAKLLELGVWDYFVFPQINWNPKGKNVKQIISSAQLRPANVLFLDDNHLNLAEVEFYNQGIFTKEPDFIPEISKHKAFTGKDDTALTRLQQYKILEEKEKEKEHFSDNIHFLESSDIHLAIIENLEPIIDRIHELINRTNQINYTKKRIDKNELEVLLKDSDYECKAVKVKDRFGEYGIVGFYALLKRKNQLEHFLFSCRSMNIGLEQYMYAKLNFPELQRVGDVTVELNSKDHPHWIKEVNDWTNDNQNKGSSSTKIFLKGACDLRQMAHYLSYKDLEVDTEYNNVNQNNHPIPKAHTEILLQSESLDEESKSELIASFPFLDQQVFDTDVFSSNYDILVYSLLVDYTMDLYQSKSSGIKIPYESYSDFVNESKAEFVARCKKHEFKNMNEVFYDFFSTEYDFIGQITENQLIKNLKTIRKKVKKPIIFINGAEVDTPAANKSEYGKARIRHEKMNNALEQFCNSHKDTYILDVREFISETDINHSIRHYKRSVYENMANELISTIENIKEQKLERNEFEYQFKRSLKILRSTFKEFAKNILLRASSLF